MDVKTASGGPAPTVLPGENPDQVTDPESTDEENTPPVVTPVEKTEALFTEGDKKYFQSRDAIILRVKRELVEGADSFSVLNITNSGEDDSKAILLVDHDTAELGLRSMSGFELAASAEDLILRFYPGNESWKGKFFYSPSKPNKIKVIAHDEANPRFSIIDDCLCT